ncbi:MAG: hypothetical protein R2700_08735 [Solirubrobacterales bacterium]
MKEDVRELGLEGVGVRSGREVVASRPHLAIVPATRPIICLTERSRSGEPSGPRKYFWATMLVAF